MQPTKPPTQRTAPPVDSLLTAAPSSATRHTPCALLESQRHLPASRSGPLRSGASSPGRCRTWWFTYSSITIAVDPSTSCDLSSRGRPEPELPDPRRSVVGSLGAWYPGAPRERPRRGLLRPARGRRRRRRRRPSSSGRRPRPRPRRWPGRRRSWWCWPGARGVVVVVVVGSVVVVGAASGSHRRAAAQDATATTSPVPNVTPRSVTNGNVATRPPAMASPMLFSAS